jgi:hypothetical protein
MVCVFKLLVLDTAVVSLFLYILTHSHHMAHQTPYPHTRSVIKFSNEDRALQEIIGDLMRNRDVTLQLWLRD